MIFLQRYIYMKLINIDFQCNFMQVIYFFFHKFRIGVTKDIAFNNSSRTAIIERSQLKYVKVIMKRYNTPVTFSFS